MYYTLRLHVHTYLETFILCYVSSADCVQTKVIIVARSVCLQSVLYIIRTWCRSAQNQFKLLSSVGIQSTTLWVGRSNVVKAMIMN